MDIPIIEQVKIQAQVLVPLLKALQAELGEERANAIVSKALGEQTRNWAQKWWRAQGEHSPAEKVAALLPRFSAGNAIDVELLTQTQDAVEFNITGCRYAQFYRELGAPELGFLLVCSQDFSMTEGFGPEVEFTRTQTIMQGASHCDFRYRLKKGTGTNPK
jgi:predicted ArsR family transcriptional regulator